MAGLPPLVHIRYIPIQGEAFLLVEKPPLVYVPNMYKGRQGEAGKARGGNSTYPPYPKPEAILLLKNSHLYTHKIKDNHMFQELKRY